jgi:proteic killer suppression protein
LEISFSSKELRAICEQHCEADRVLGEPVAKVLRARLSDLFAVERYDDMPLGNARIAFIDSEECITIDIKDGVEMCLNSGHINTSKCEDKTIDWPKVSRLKLIYIGTKR